MSVELLSTYVAMDRRHAVVGGEDIPDRTKASVLLADISGFTPLTEALAGALGPRRGAEELTTILNSIYTSLVSQVHAFGGSVVCFIGDALIGLFDGDEGARAVACALAMQEAMRAFDAVPVPQGGTISLAMKAAIEAGPVRRFLVGDPGIQLIDVLAGATVDRLTDAEHLAERGEVIAAPHLARALGDDLIIDAWREGHGVVRGLRSPLQPTPWDDLGLDESAAGILRSHLLDEVHERVQAGQGDFLAELRPIAALFLRFGGFDYDERDDAGEQLDALAAWVQRTVQSYGGHVLMLTTADKGSHLYAAFGALEAHEDDADRAVAAALALRKPPADLDFAKDLRIGVSQGRVRVGAYGGAARHTYGALGETVNLAARLMGVAPAGGIRCSERIHAATASRFDFNEHPAVMLKGMAQAQVLFEPTGERRFDGALEAIDLVGREEEVATVKEQLASVREGGRRILFVEGEAGIGKSAMIGALHALASEMNTGWLLGAASSMEQNTPYHAWRSIVSTLFKIDPADEPEEKGRRVLEEITALDPTYVDRAPLLNDVLGLDLPETSLTRSYDPQLRREGLASLLGDLLRREAESNPVVVVLDDVHWLDSLSWGLALSVARSMVDRSALFVLVHRPLDEPTPHPYRTLQASADAHVLSLGSLPAEQTAALAASRLGLLPNALPDEVADLLIERAEGNPFYALELIGALRDQGLIHIEDGTCAIVGDPAALRERVPDTLEGVVLSRIDQLPVEEQLTVKVASVIGRSFLARTLQAVFPGSIEDETLRAHLNLTDQRQLTQLEAEDPDRSYAFRHVVTRDVAYETLLFEQRRELHRGVAGWLEATYAELLAPHYPLLAFHWYHAGELEKELEYAQLAGRQAADQYANEEALHYFSRVAELVDALDADPASDRRLEALRSRVGVLSVLGRVDEERADLEMLRTICERKDEACQSEVDLLWADLHRRGGRFTEAIDEAERALERLQVLGDREGQARALTCIGNCLEGLGQFAEARPRLEEAVAIFRESETLAGQAGNAVRALGIISARLGDFPQAMERFGEAHELFRRVGDRKGEGEVYGNLGAVSYYFGEYEGCVGNSRKAQEIFREMGNRSGMAKCLANIGSAYRDLGAFEEALDFHTRALGIFRQLDDAKECASNTFNAACDLHALGVGGYPSLFPSTVADSSRLHSAIEGFEEALAKYTEIGSQWGKVLANLRLGSVWLNSGDTQQAEPYLRVALDLSQEVGMASQEMQALSALSRAMLMRGDIEAAMSFSDKAMEKLGDSSPPFADELHFTRSRVLEAAGRREESLPHLRKSRECVLEYAGAIRDKALQEGFLAACRPILEA